MFEMLTEFVRKNDNKELLFELACECTVAYLNEKQASDIIEEMHRCKSCKKPVYLVSEE